MTRTQALPPLSDVLGGLTVAAAAYLTALLALYFFPPHLPRHQLESAYFVLVGLGVAAVIARHSADARSNRLRPDSALRASSRSRRSASREGGQGYGGPPKLHAKAGGRAYIFSVVAALTGVAFAIYHRALTIGFLSDDFVVADFARRHEWVYGTDVAFARLLVPLLWAALEYVPAPFDSAVHATSILLHGINGALVVLVAARLEMPRIQAIAAGLLFIASPALSEAVAWSTGVHDVLMTTFCLIAVLAATAEPLGWRAVTAAVTATVLALSAKETSVVIPALVVLVTWAAGLPFTRPARAWMLGALVGISAIYAGFRLMAGVPADYGDNVLRVYFVKQFIVGPFAALGAPWTVAWAAGHSTAAFVRSVTILALVTGALVMCRRNSPALKRAVVSAAWVLVGILPVFTLFYIGPSLEGSRYLYLPAVGFAIMLPVLAGSFAAAFPRRIAAALAVAALLASTVPVVPALRHEIGRWEEAARIRDAILARARENSSIVRCRSIISGDLADNVDGAYVFRNGLLQALAVARGDAIADGDRTCRISWNGQDLRVLLD